MKVIEKEGRHLFHSVDSDPFFQISPEEKIIHAGWYIINFSFKLDAGKVILPKIYFDFGNGFSEEFRWRLFYANNEIFGMVKVPWNCFRLRFDISEKNLEFEVGSFSIKRVNKIHGTLHLLSILEKLGVNRRHFLREIMGKNNNRERKQLLRSVSDGSYFSLAYHQFPENRSGLKSSIQKTDELEIHSTITAANLSTLAKNREKIKALYATRSVKQFLKTEVDIIIPVYNGYEFLITLLPQILVNSDLPYKLYILDDCSTDERVYPYLETFQKNHPNIQVLKNETNLGFTKTVNKLLQISRNKIIVLLNSDIEVPVNWLSKLIYPMQLDSSIGTITPISNCASICSFPNMGDNPLLNGMNVEGMNNCLEHMGPHYEEIPTGVGFCLAINRKMLASTGFLNEEAFPRGYGEEVDLCFRGRKNGYKSVLNTQLFVYHKHGGSFSSEEKARLMNENQQKLETIHPDFTPVLQKYFRGNTFILVKIIYLLKLTRDHGKKITLFLDHDLGGGTNQYSKNYQHLQSNTIFINALNINPNQNPGKRILFSIRLQNQELKFLANDLANFLDLLKGYQFALDEIIINNVVSFNKVLSLTRAIISYKKSIGKKTVLRIMCHDFFYICPNFLLFNNNEEFCGIPDDLLICRNCLKSLASSIDPKLVPSDFGSLQQWRDNWKELLLEHANEVVMFSESTRNHFLKLWPELRPVTVVKPHKLNNFKRFNSKTYNIGILGNIHSIAKGAKYVQGLAEFIASQKRSNFRLFNFGGIHPRFDHPSIIKAGPYTYEDLHYKLVVNKIDVILIPSLCSETFSFTTREAIETGIPTASFILGGQFDQLKNYEKGIQIIDTRPESFLNAIEEYFKTEVYEAL